MAKPSRDKGKRGEREAVQKCIEHWNANPAHCRRSAQVSGVLTSDVVGALPDTHIEVKLYERLPASDFLAQAISDSFHAAGGGRNMSDLPVVLMRQTGTKGIKDWIVMVRMSDSVEFAEKLLAQVKNVYV